MGRNSIHNIGDRYGHLEILEIIPSNIKGKHVKLNCVCHNCGSNKLINGVNIKKRISCGCLQRNSSSWKSIGPKTRSWQLQSGQAAKNNLFYQYRRGAEKRNLVWSLTEEQFFKIVIDKCFYCGDSLTNVMKGQGKTSGDFKYTGIDRFDNKKGYTIPNCVPCCWRCNNMKSSYTNNEFMNQIDKIYNHMNRKRFINEQS